MKYATRLGTALSFGLFVAWASASFAYAGGFGIPEMGVRRTGMAAIVGRPDEPHPPRLGADGVIILAADVPPDVPVHQEVLPTVLIGRGTADPWYTADKQEADVATLARLGVTVENCVFDGGHEWGEPFRQAAGTYLTQIARGR